jgi:hypothetical protein
MLQVGARAKIIWPVSIVRGKNYHPFFVFFGNNHQPSNHPLGGYLGIWMDMRVSIVMGVPQKLDCLFNGKSQSKMDDLEVPPFQESPI